MSKDLTKFTRKELKTVYAVFETLNRMPYSELNTFLGSMTIDEMQEILVKIRPMFRVYEEVEV